MVHYVDTSALVKLVVAGPETAGLRAWLAETEPTLVAADLVIASKRDLLRAGAALEWPRTPDALVAAPDDEPGALRVGLGRLLRQLRGLPPAGPVGGFAALDRSEGERLSQALAGS